MKILPLALLALALSGCTAATAPSPTKPSIKTGAYSDSATPTPEQYALFEKAAKGTEAEGFKPQSVAVQVVAGLNYAFLCSTPDETKRYRVVIFEPLPYTKTPPRVTSVNPL